MSYDQHNVDSALANYPVQLTPAERREVVHHLTERGWSAAEIAERLRTTPRNIVRYRRTWTPQPDAHTPNTPPRPYPEDDFDDRKMRAAAARFIGAVHDRENVWDNLATMPPDDIKALAIICAAACNPNQPINSMLAWIDQPEAAAS